MPVPIQIQARCISGPEKTSSAPQPMMQSRNQPDGGVAKDRPTKPKSLPCALLALGLSVCLSRGADEPPADLVPYAGLSPQEACAKATLPPGFQMHAFAHEPDLVQPIAFAL